MNEHRGSIFDLTLITVSFVVLAFALIISWRIGLSLQANLPASMTTGNAGLTLNTVMGLGGLLDGSAVIGRVFAGDAVGKFQDRDVGSYQRPVGIGCQT